MHPMFKLTISPSMPDRYRRTYAGFHGIEADEGFP